MRNKQNTVCDSFSKWVDTSPTREIWQLPSGRVQSAKLSISKLRRSISPALMLCLHDTQCAKRNLMKPENDMFYTLTHTPIPTHPHTHTPIQANNGSMHIKRKNKTPPPGLLLRKQLAESGNVWRRDQRITLTLNCARS